MVASLRGRSNLPTLTIWTGPGDRCGFHEHHCQDSIWPGRACTNTENACNAMSPGTNGKEPCAKLQLQHRPVLVPDGYSVLFPLIRQAHHIRCSFALSRRDPPRPHSKRAKRSQESTNSKRVSTEAESETDPVAGDDALAYIRRRAVQPSPTALHMQGISSTRTSTYS